MRLKVFLSGDNKNNLRIIFFDYLVYNNYFIKKNWKEFLIEIEGYLNYDLGKDLGYIESFAGNGVIIEGDEINDLIRGIEEIVMLMEII